MSKRHEDEERGRSNMNVVVRDVVRQGSVTNNRGGRLRHDPDRHAR